MTQFKTLAQLAALSEYKKDLKKSLAKAKGQTPVFYCKKFKFGTKTGPVLVVGPIDKKLLAELKQQFSAGKEGRCVRAKTGGFEWFGKVTAEDFGAALEYVGLGQDEIEAEGESDDRALEEIHDKRVDRGLKSVDRPLSDAEAEEQGEDIARLFQTEEDVQQEIETEKRLFEQFPQDVDTYATREQSLTPVQRKALDKAMANMIRRAEAKHAELFGGRRELSAADLDELIKVFEHIPRGLVPPRFKKELQDWRETRDAMNEMAVAELMKGEDPEVVEGVRGVIEALTTPAGMVASVGGVVGGEKFEHVKDVIEKAAGALENISNSLGALQAGKESLSSEERTALEQRMADDETVAALTELADTAMELGGNFIPVIGTINNAKNVVLSGATTLSRMNKAMGDGILRDIASRDAASQLARALGQSCSRQKRLAAEAGVKTVTSAIGVASDVSIAADAGTLKIVNGVLTVGSKAVFNIADAVSDTRAVNVLRAARAGDEQAQQEVFSRHAHYAKFLLANAAKKGDSLARMFFIDRELTEADIEENSAEILMKFGLQESAETAAPESTPEKIRAGLEKAADVAGRIGGKVKSGIKSAWAFVTGASADDPEPPAAEIEQLFGVQALKSMTATLQRARRQKAAMRGAPAPAWLDENLESLEQGLAAAGTPLRKYLGVLTNELAKAAPDTSPAGVAKVIAIRAQIEPLREAIGYLADEGFL